VERDVTEEKQKERIKNESGRKTMMR
jgi:hypothetical protein